MIATSLDHVGSLKLNLLMIYTTQARSCIKNRRRIVHGDNQKKTPAPNPSKYIPK